MKTLYAGFFAGEFGWQLMRWQGHLRYLSNEYKIVVGCEKQYRFLYEDFASGFIDFKEEIHSRNMWLCNQIIYPIEKENCIVPSREICMNPDLKQEFIKFGNSLGGEYGFERVVLIHARESDNLNTSYRNYKQWESVVNWVRGENIPVASIGTRKESRYIEGTADFRDLSLETIASIMAFSKLLISPSSGPAHFASLCGCPHLVWSGDEGDSIMSNKERYAKTWNPLNTENHFIEGWQPEPETIINKLKEIL